MVTAKEHLCDSNFISTIGLTLSKTKRYPKHPLNSLNRRFLALRQEDEVYHNAGVIRTNAMKYLPNFFRKGKEFIKSICWNIASVCQYMI